jgi:phosphomevalonate kinase
MRLSVPGNLLLLGEYAVLEEGGLGLAMAIERRASIIVEPARDLSIIGAWPGAEVSWTPEHATASPLFSAAVETVQAWLAAQTPSGRIPGASIRIDTSKLFHTGGRKSGLSSSAAVAVGLVCALLHAAGREDVLHGDILALLAVRAHRKAQGGAGSGYDVMCSAKGGIGLFHGGATPSWEPRSLGWDPEVALFAGPAPVATSGAVGFYRAWKARDPGAAAAFLEESNIRVLEFIRAQSLAAAIPRLDACRKLGMRVGEAIGVPARIETPAGLDPRMCKAVGAGCELGACLLVPGGPADPAPRDSASDSEGFERVRISIEGVAWER